MKRPNRLVVLLALGGLVWCVAASLYVWFAPIGISRRGSSETDTVTEVGIRFSSISEWGSLPLIVTVVLAAVAAWSAFRGHRVVLAGAAVLLAAYSVLTGFSIGLFYLPAAAVLIVASITAFASSEAGPGGRDDDGSTTQGPH